MAFVFNKKKVIFIITINKHFPNPFLQFLSFTCLSFIMFRIFLAFTCLLSISFSLLTSCNSSPPTTDQTGEESLPPSGIRGKKISNKIMAYKSLATFNKGETTISLEKLADVDEKKVNLVVLFDVTAPWASSINITEQAIEEQTINSLIDSYELTMLQQFDLDDESKGLVFDIDNQNTPVEAARELSMIEHVLLVHVKEIPQKTSSYSVRDKE